jgi:hypothetical protein
LRKRRREGKRKKKTNFFLLLKQELLEINVIIFQFFPGFLPDLKEILI